MANRLVIVSCSDTVKEERERATSRGILFQAQYYGGGGGNSSKLQSTMLLQRKQEERIAKN